MEAVRKSSDRKQTEEEYKLIAEAFRRMLDVYENGAERMDVFEDIVTLRASFLIDRVLSGMSLDFDKALVIIRNHNEFNTKFERQQRDTLLAAIDNLIDFATAEEYSMLSELPQETGGKYREETETICKRYNLTNAAQENDDVRFASSVAAWWMTVSEDTYLTFMTQADERVRAWHLSHEGVTYAKPNFPPELIPPIEWGCRCFLLTNSYAAVTGSSDTKRVVDGVNPIFSESLAVGGRIFTEHHPYFKKTLSAEVADIKNRIKQKFNL